MQKSLTEARQTRQEMEKTITEKDQETSSLQLQIYKVHRENEDLVGQSVICVPSFPPSFLPSFPPSLPPSLPPSDSLPRACPAAAAQERGDGHAYPN